MVYVTNPNLTSLTSVSVTGFLCVHFTLSEKINLTSIERERETACIVGWAWKLPRAAALQSDEIPNIL